MHFASLCWVCTVVSLLYLINKRISNTKDHCLLIPLLQCSLKDIMSFLWKAVLILPLQLWHDLTDAELCKRLSPASGGTWTLPLALLTHVISLTQVLQGWNSSSSHSVRELKLTHKSFILNFWQTFVRNYLVLWGIIKSNCLGFLCFSLAGEFFFFFFLQCFLFSSLFGAWNINKNKISKWWWSWGILHFSLDPHQALKLFSHAIQRTMKNDLKI